MSATSTPTLTVGSPLRKQPRQGALGVLQHEDLDQPGRVAGRGHRLQAALLVAENDPAGVCTQQLDAALGEGVQGVDRAEVLDQGLGHLDEDL